MDGGTDFTIFLVYNDNTLEERFFYDPSALVPIEHLFDAAAGSYSVDIIASNDRSNVQVTVSAEVDIRIANVEFTTHAAEFGQPVKLCQTVEAGSRLTAFWLFGDGFAEQRCYDNHTEVSDCIEYTYGEPGIYTVTLTITNCLGRSQHVAEVIVVTPIEDLELTTTALVSTIGDLSVFNRTVTNGSHLTCMLNYGDGFMDLAKYTRNSTEYALEDTFQHIYEEPGVFEAFLTCFNPISSVNVTVTVIAQEAISGLTVLPPVVYHPYGKDLAVGWSIENGTNVTVTTTLDGSSAPQTPLSDFSMQGQLLYPQPIELGYHTLNITGTNLVSEDFVVIELYIEEEIVAQISCSKEYAKPSPDNFDITMESTSGSYIFYVIDYGTDSQEDILLQMHTLTGACSKTAQGEYTDPGYYQLNITLLNNVSSTFEVCDIGIENPVVDLTLTGLDVNNTESAVNLTISQTGGAPPTSAEATWSFGDGGPTETTTCPVSDSTPVEKKHFYSTAGTYSVDVTVSNNVSSVELSAEVQVGLDITGFSIEVQTGQLHTDTALVFTLRVRTGSDVEYEVNFDDGDTPTQLSRTTPGELEDTTQVPYVYAVPGRKEVVVRATNPFGSFQESLSIEVLEVISGPSLEIETIIYHNVEEQVRFVASVAAGSNVRASIDYGDNTQDQKDHEVPDASQAPVVFEKVYQTPGNYTVVVNFTNSISSESAEIPLVIIQAALGDVVIQTATNPAAVPGDATYSVSNVNPSSRPSNPFCSWNFADGATLITYAGELMEGASHEVVHFYNGSITDNVTATVNCSNFVSSSIAEVNVTLQRTIENLTLTASADAYSINVQAHFVIKCLTGSHVEFLIKYGDDRSKNILHSNSLDSTAPLDDTHVYLFPQNFTLSVTASNRISSQEALLSLTIQTPIETLTVRAEQSSISYPPGQASFEAFISETNDPPIDVHCYWTYGDGTPPESSYLSVVQSSDVIAKSHTYGESAVGNVNVTVACGNMVSSVTAVTPLSILRSIENFNVSVGDGAYATAASVMFTASVEKGVNVIYTVNYGDGTSGEETVSGNAAGEVVEFQHEYNDPNNYTVDVTAENDVSSYSVEKDVIIQNKLIHDDLELTYQSVMSSSDDIIMNLAVREGKLAPSDVHVVANCNGIQSIYLYVEQWPLTIQFADDKIGDVTVTLRCSNMVSQDEHTSTIRVEEEIGSMSVDSPDQVILGEPVTVGLAVQAGSHLTVDVDYGDTDSDQLTSDTKQELFSFSHTYAGPGKYVVTCTATNQVSGPRSTSKVIIVQSDLSGAELDLEPFASLESSVSGSVVPNNLFDSNTTITVKCDSNVADADASIYTDSNAFACSYNETGFHNIQVTVANLVSSKTLTQAVQVEELVAGLEFTVKNTDSSVSGQTSFPTNVPLEFKASIGGGTNVTYTWTLDDHDTRKTTSKVLDYTYTRPGTFEVEVVASNAVNEESRKKTLTISDPVGVEAIHYKDVAIINERTVITIELSGEISPICYRFLIRSEETGTERMKWTGSSSGFCQEDSDFVETEFEQIVATTELVVAEVFTELGNHVIDIKVFTEEKAVTLSAQILVKDIPCDSPIVEMNGIGETMEHRRIVTKSRELLVTSSLFGIKVECNVTDKVVMSWNMSAYNNLNNFNPVSFSAVDAVVVVGGVLIKPLALSYGIYRFHLTVHMDGLPDKMGEGDVYVEVVGTPLVVEIAEGAELLIGHGQVLTIDGITKSYDPDDDIDNKSALRIKWACMKVNEGYGFVWETAQVVSVPSIDAPENMDRDIIRPGCFGEGPGILNSVKGILTFNTGYMNVDTTYIFHLKIEKSLLQDERQGTDEIAVRVERGRRPMVWITCDELSFNCKTKVNPDSKLSLWGTCDLCDEAILEGLKFVWNLFNENGDSLTEAEKVMETSITINTMGTHSHVTIPGNVLKRGSLLSAKLTIEVPLHEKGRSSMEREVDSGPYGGTCSVTPSKGLAVQDLFTIDCSGWKTDSMIGEDGINFAHQYEQNGETVVIPGSHTYLPASHGEATNLTITSIITNFYGTATSVDNHVLVLPVLSTSSGSSSSAEDLASLVEQSVEEDTSQNVLNLEMSLTKMTAMANLINDASLTMGSSSESGSGTSDGSSGSGSGTGGGSSGSGSGTGDGSSGSGSGTGDGSSGSGSGTGGGSSGSGSSGSGSGTGDGSSGSGSGTGGGSSGSGSGTGGGSSGSGSGTGGGSSGSGSGTGGGSSGSGSGTGGGSSGSGSGTSGGSSGSGSGTDGGSFATSTPNAVVGDDDVIVVSIDYNIRSNSTTFPLLSKEEQARILKWEEEEKKRLEELQNQRLIASVAQKVEDMAKSGGLVDSQFVSVMTTYGTVTAVMTDKSPADTRVSGFNFVADLMEDSMKTIKSSETQVNLVHEALKTVKNLGETLDPEPQEPVSDELPLDITPNYVKEENLKKEAIQKREEEIALQQQAKDCLDRVTKVTGDAVYGDIKTNAEPFVVSNEKLGLSISKSTPDHLTKKTLKTEGGSLSLGRLDTSPTSFFAPEEEIKIKVGTSKINFFAFETDGDEAQPPLVTIDVETKREGSFEVDDMEQPIVVTLKHEQFKGENESFSGLGNATIDEDTGMIYNMVNLTVPGLFFQTDIKPGPTAHPDTTISVYINVNATLAVADRPNITNHDFYFLLPNQTNPPGKEWNVFLTERELAGDLLYVGFIVHEPSDDGRAKRDVSGSDGGSNSTSPGNSTLPDIRLRTVLASCRAWDSFINRWTYDTCKVSSSSTAEETQCLCTKLTDKVKTFAGGIQLPAVNPINFKDIFGNFAARLAASPTVLGTMLGITALYILLVIWARRSDKKDVEKWDVAPLLDNRANHHVYYKVSVYTGLRQNSGTRSKVFMVMSGDNGDTGVRALDDGREKNFPRASVRHFLMTTRDALGSLTFMRVWHDNSGKSEHADWFLDKVVVEDLRDKKRYFFLCGRWMATDEGDGQVERIMPVAGEEEVTGFHHLFFAKARQNLTDDHLWLSVLARPTKSTFTRVQRLTCCLTLLFTTMIANAMFFQGTTAETDSKSGSVEMSNGGDQTITLGPLVLSVQALLISIFGSLVIIPVNTILVMFFRKVRPKGWIDSEDRKEIQKAINEQAERKQNADSDRFEKSMTDLDTISMNESEYEYVEEEVEVEQVYQRKKRWWRKKYPLPPFFLYIAWVIAILACVVSAFFVVFYSLEWGDDRSKEWLSSILLSFFESVIIVQPIKVIFLAMFMSMIFRTLEEMDDEDKKKCEEKAAKLKADPMISFRSLAPTTSLVKPPSQSELVTARQRRVFEKKTWGVIREVAFYFLFLLLISFIAWGAQDDTVFKMNRHIHGLFSGDDARYSYKKVKDGHKFWEWLEKGAIPAMFFDQEYNGKPTIRRDRGYLSDSVSYRVGAPRLRQLRVVPASCNVVEEVRRLMIECNEPYTMLSEENRNFTVGWYLGHENKTELTRTELAYKYQGILTLKGLPYWGRHATYGGGGYVADLGVSSYDAHKVVKELIKNSWVDLYTRAVFLEFTLYNPSINLFAYVNYLMEFPPTGGVMPFPRVMTFSIYSGLGGMGGMILFCEIIYVIVVIYFIYREGKKLKNNRKAYFMEPWNVLELTLIIVSVIAISMFAMKHTFGRIIMRQLKKNIEGYTNYMALATYGEVYSYVIGIIIFLANVKFMRILRFNRHICELAATLKQARRDICYFGVTFGIIFVAFSTFGYVVFGKNMFTFATFTLTFETLYSMLIGRFEFGEMQAADTAIGRMFFVVFVLVVFFILVNMFLGILGTAYFEVRQNPSLVEQDYEVIEFLINKVKAFFGFKSARTVDTGSAYIDPMDSLDARISSIDRALDEIYSEMLEGPLRAKQSKATAAAAADTPTNTSQKKQSSKGTFFSKLLSKIGLGEEKTIETEPELPPVEAEPQYRF